MHGSLDPKVNDGGLMNVPSSSPPKASFSPPDLATILHSATEALRLVIESKPETNRLLAEMVRLSGGALNAGAAGTWVTETPDAPELILEHNLGPIGLMVNGAPLAGLNVAVRRSTREGKPVIVPAFFVDDPGHSQAHAGTETPSNPSPFELLFIPMRLRGKVSMVLMMAVQPSNNAGMHRTQINFLQKMVGAVEQTLTLRHLSLMEKSHGATSSILKFAEQVHKHLFVGQVAVDIANLVRDAVSADRVTVELYPRARKKVVAVSNVDEPNKRSVVFQAQRLILDYVRDRQLSVMLDRAAAKQLVNDPALQDAATAYFAASAFDGFLATPIKQDDTVKGVIITEFADGKRGPSQAAALADLSRVAASSVANAVEYESIPLRKTLHVLGQLWRSPMNTKKKATLSIVAAALVAIVVLALWPVDFSVKADCTLRPVAHHSIVAPADGKILEVNVRAGEHVYADPNPQHLPLEQLDAETRNKVETVKPMMVFDDTDLKAMKSNQLYKISELQTKIASLSDRDKDTIAQRQELQHQISGVQSELELIQKKIEACRVYSPIEGTVLTENVEAKKYSSVKMGEPLLDVASSRDWVLVVDVPEQEVATVHGALERASRKGANDGAAEDPGIQIEYILYPWPEQRYVSQARGVERLLPSSVQSSGHNVFRLEIPVKQEGVPTGIATFGVTGRAKVHLGNKPLATQWLRGPWRLFKMTLGF